VNFVDVIRRETRGLEARTAVIDGPRVATYGELLVAVSAAAASLRGLGIRPAQRIAFLCEDGLDYIVGSLAVLAAGAAVVPVAANQAEGEIQALCERMDVHALLFDRALRPAAEARPVTGVPLAACSFALAPRAARDEFPPEYGALEPAFIRFSSGTTGASKGVLLSHATIEARTAAADQGLRITADDTVLWVLSMSFHFVVSILLFLRRGATIVVCNRVFPQMLFDGVTQHRGTFIYASPFHYHTLAKSDLFAPDSLARVRLAISTAMKLPAETAEAFRVKFGFGLAEAYGIIEVGLPVINLGGEAPRKPGSVGRVLPDFEVRIDRPDAAGVGDIRLRGPGLFDAYVSPWQTREECFPDGWFRTGDVGRLDEDGFLFIVGRANAVINFAGMKVFPDEVEQVLNQHPQVRESLVYGVPHAQFGQMPQAKLVLREEGTELDLQDVRRFCYQRLSPYMVPKGFECVAALPRTASGKLKRA
jgi:long-chain acyl-CoA synthetase